MSTTTIEKAQTAFQNHLRNNGWFPCHLRRLSDCERDEMECVRVGFDADVVITYHQGPVPLHACLILDLKFLEKWGEGDFGYRWTRDDILGA